MAYQPYPLLSQPFKYSTIFGNLLIISILLFLPPYTHALNFNFNFSNFDINQAGDLILQGDANISGAAIKLTNSQNYSLTNSMGRASYREALQLWDVQGNTTTLVEFTTHFSFNISSVNGTFLPAHGLAFFLVPEEEKWIPNRSVDGGLLGLFNSQASALYNTTKNQVVAVEFDTYTDLWDPTIDGQHIGVDVNSIKSERYVPVTKGLVNRGTASACVSYDSMTKNLSAHLSFDGSSDSYDVSYVIDLSDVLPQRVHVGFTATTDTFILYETHQVFSWSFNSSLNQNPQSSHNTKSGTKVGVFVAVGLVGIIAVVLTSVVGVYYYRLCRKVQADQTQFDDLGGKKFSYSQLSRATNNFSKERKLGSGGFGDVYEGCLASPKIKVAVKKFRSGSNQGEKEYVSEVNIISKLRHRNIVSLIGWSHDRGELLLVYEFMPNRSLDFHLYGEDILLLPLPWSNRYKIAVGLASAVHYLHEEGDQCVVHRDIKSSNVMLDSDFNARLGDFGLARFTGHGQSLRTTIPAGTLGYLAPEWMKTGKASKQSDVYSFGIVSLEIACGRRPIEPEEEDPEKVSLVEWVVNLHAKGFVLEAVDKRLNAEFDEDQARRLLVVGLWCCHPDPSHRPSMKQAIAALNVEAPLPSLSQVTMPMNVSPNTNAFPTNMVPATLM